MLVGEWLPLQYAVRTWELFRNSKTLTNALDSKSMAGGAFQEGRDASGSNNESLLFLCYASFVLLHFFSQFLNRRRKAVDTVYCTITTTTSPFNKRAVHFVVRLIKKTPSP